jgi:hypothetical protein
VHVPTAKASPLAPPASAAASCFSLDTRHRLGVLTPHLVCVCQESAKAPARAAQPSLCSLQSAEGTPMRCPHCQHENREGACYCATCGSSFASKCPACGRQPPPGAAFCDQCGTPLTGTITAAIPSSPAARPQMPQAYTPPPLAARMEQKARWWPQRRRSMRGWPIPSCAFSGAQRFDRSHHVHGDETRRIPHFQRPIDIKADKLHHACASWSAMLGMPSRRCHDQIMPVTSSLGKVLRPWLAREPTAPLQAVQVVIAVVRVGRCVPL